MISSHNKVEWPCAHGLLSDALILPEVFFRLRGCLSGWKSISEIRLGNAWLKSWSEAELQMQKVDSKFGVSLRFDGLELAISGGPGRKVHVSTAGDFSLQKTEVRGLINLIAENFRITQILMVDPAYSASQSIKDIELFKRYFGPNSTGSLKIESNRLPVPLERQEIVIRENPGRLIFRRGYIEGVASEMWLGRSFWPHCTSDKGKILSHEWLEATDCENFLYLRAVPECFNKEDGEEGRIQHRLLQLFFGKKNGG